MIESQKDMTEEERKKLEKAEWDEIWESVEKYSPMFQSKPTQEPKKDLSKVLEQLNMTEQEKEKQEISKDMGEALEAMKENNWLFRSKSKQATVVLEPSDMTQEKSSKSASTMDKTTRVWNINGEQIPVTIRRIRCGYASKMKYDLPEPLKSEPEGEVLENEKSI